MIRLGMTLLDQQRLHRLADLLIARRHAERELVMPNAQAVRELARLNQEIAAHRALLLGDASGNDVLSGTPTDPS